MGKRNDLRETDAFLRGHPPAALFIAAVCVLAGIGSVLGYLRARAPFFQWGLAIAAWSFAGFCVDRGLRGLRGD